MTGGSENARQSRKNNTSDILLQRNHLPHLRSDDISCAVLATMFYVHNISNIILSYIVAFVN